MGRQASAITQGPVRNRAFIVVAIIAQEPRYVNPTRRAIIFLIADLTGRIFRVILIVGD